MIHTNYESARDIKFHRENLNIYELNFYLFIIIYIKKKIKRQQLRVR